MNSLYLQSTAGIVTKYLPTYIVFNTLFKHCIICRIRYTIFNYVVYAIQLYTTDILLGFQSPDRQISKKKTRYKRGLSILLLGDHDNKEKV